MTTGTSRYDWTYPELSDPPTVSTHFQTLAENVEETVGAIDDRVTSLTGLSQSIMQYTTLTRVSSSVMTIPTSVWTPIIWDAAQFNLPTSDPGFVFASPTRITIKQTGLYQFTGFCGFAVNSTGSRAIGIRVNGNPSYVAISSGDTPPGDIGWYGCAVAEARANADDFVELVVRQTSGAGLKIDTVYPRFSVRRMV